MILQKAHREHACARQPPVSSPARRTLPARARVDQRTLHNTTSKHKARSVTFSARSCIQLALPSSHKAWLARGQPQAQQGKAVHARQLSLCHRSISNVPRLAPIDRRVQARWNIHALSAKQVSTRPSCALEQGPEMRSSSYEFDRRLVTRRRVPGAPGRAARTRWREHAGGRPVSCSRSCTQAATPTSGLSPAPCAVWGDRLGRRTLGNALAAERRRTRPAEPRRPLMRIVAYVHEI